MERFPLRRVEAEPLTVRQRFFGLPQGALEHELADRPARRSRRRFASALIFALVRAGLVDAWVSPATLAEHVDVLSDHPEFVAEVAAACAVCYPLTELSVIRHEPDNRFLECALAVRADFLVTVNTAPGHFDRKHFGTVRVVRPRARPNRGRCASQLVARGARRMIRGRGMRDGTRRNCAPRGRSRSEWRPQQVVTTRP